MLITILQKTSDEQKQATQAAVLNKNFRQAVNFAIDRTAYSAQSNGEEAVRTLFVTRLYHQLSYKLETRLLVKQLLPNWSTMVHNGQI